MKTVVFILIFSLFILIFSLSASAQAKKAVPAELETKTGTSSEVREALKDFDFDALSISPNNLTSQDIENLSENFLPAVKPHLLHGGELIERLARIAAPIFLLHKTVRSRTVVYDDRAPAQVGGRVTQPNGRGIVRALVTMTDSQGVERTAYTDRQGFFSFGGVPGGLTYFFSVSHLRYRFEQPSQVRFIGEDTAGVNFVGTNIGGLQERYKLPAGDTVGDSAPKDR